MNPFQWNEAHLFSFFFVFIRVSAILIFLPIFGDRMVPAPVKVLLSLAIAWVCYPILAASGVAVKPALYATSEGILFSMIQEGMLGALIGYASRWIFEAAQFAGQVSGIAMGFSMPSILDPNTEAQNVALSELKYLLTALLFLAMNGHHLYLGAITESFRFVPLGAPDWFSHSNQVIHYLVKMTAEILVVAVKLSSPIIAVILIVNVTFGLASRAVPQMNVFAVSFGANIIVGMLVILVSIPAFTNLVSNLFDSYTSELFKLVKLFHG